MSLIQNLEIDTLRLRNLLVRNPDNTPIPANYHLYSKGDGGTYWSTGVDARQFTSLSSQVSTNTGNFTNVIRIASTSIAGALNSTISTVYGFSTFAQNLSTYSAATAYTDQQIQLLGCEIVINLSTYYVSKDDLGVASTAIYAALTSTSDGLTSSINTLSSQNASTLLLISSITDVNIGQIQALSTYTASTFGGVFVIESTNYGTLATTIDGQKIYFDGQISVLSSNVGAQAQITNGTTSTLAAATSTLSTAIAVGDISTLRLANIYTSTTQIQTLSTTNSLISSMRSTVEGELTSTITPISTSLGSTTVGLVRDFQQLSTVAISTIITISSNINILLSTGLIANIYQTFTELEIYSYNVLNNVITSSNTFLISTVSTLEYEYISTLNFINTSTYNFLVANAYLSSISTVVPLTLSSMNAVVASTVSTFNSTILGNSITFSTIITQDISTFSSNIFTITSSYLSTVSSYLKVISVQTASSIIILEDFSNSTISAIVQLTNVNISTISSQFYTQFDTAPSIILYNIHNVSTLTNTRPITALSSLKASVANLDVSKYQNFYVLLSDLSNDVYYGLTYSTNTNALINRDIEVRIDIMSSYSNQFFVFDTDHLSHWLNRSTIYNPKSFSYLTNDASFIVPTPDTTQQVYISTFVGAYILNLRLSRDSMYLKSVYTYPYIYSNLILSTITLPTNVQSADPNPGGYTPTNYNLMYSGSGIQMTWRTNDLNMPLGVKFVGTDVAGSTIISWSGPYSSGLLSANVKVPPAPSPFATYSSIYVGIYPNSPYKNATTDGNLQAGNMVFAASTFGKPLGIVSPTLNTKITVYNPGTVSNYLQVGSLWVTNMYKENVITDKFNTYASLISTSSYPFLGNYADNGPQKAFDSNPATYFYGGNGPGNLDQNAFMAATMSSLTSAYTSSVFISTIELTGSGNIPLTGMKLKIENSNLPAPFTNGIFYSTMNITGTNSQIFTLA
jgi:hypothetical protein